MAVFIKDSARLGYHEIFVWALLFAIGCIHYALAAAPTTVTLTFNPPGTAVGTILIQDAVEVVMTCANSDSPDQYIFKQDGEVVQTGDGAATTLTIKKFNVSSAGTYLCNAKNSQGNADSVATTLTLKCTTAGNTGCGDLGKCVVESGNTFCKCRYHDAAVFASACHECENFNDGCVPTSNNPYCNGGKCAGCTKSSNGDDFCNRVINNATPKCNNVTGACEADTTPAGTTGASGGTTGKGDTPKPSSAETVTSTACLVIASAVVALMN